VTKTQRLTGFVQPVRTTDVQSPVSGRLLELFATDEGVVAAGEPIAAIEPNQQQSLLLSQARVDVKLRSVAYDRARRAAVRARELNQSGLLAARDMEDVESTLAEADATLRLAREQLTTIEKQLPETAQGHDRRFLLVAPVAGRVLPGDASPGEAIIAGTAGAANDGTIVARIVDTSRFLVRVDVNEIDILNISRGMRAAVKPVALRGRSVRGHVDRLGSEGTTTQSITVFPAEIAVDEAIPLLPGMSCDVDVIIAERTGVLAVPRSAVVQWRGSAAVYRHASKQPTPVETGLIGDDLVEITSGLRRGDVIETDRSPRDAE